MTQSASRELEPVEDILAAVHYPATVRLERFGSASGARLFAKLEQLQPAGLLEVRIAVLAIDGARTAGLLRPGQTVITGGSANEGIAVALACAVRRHPLVLAVPRGMTPEKQMTLKLYGAKLMWTPPEEGVAGARTRAAEAAVNAADAFLLNLHDSPALRAAQEEIAEEIVAVATEEGATIDALVTSAMAGASNGIARLLKERYPAMQHVEVDMVGPEVEDWPPRADREPTARLVTVTGEQAWAARARLACTEGILTGVNSAAVAHAANELAVELGAGKNVFALFADAGDRYFSLETYYR